MTMAPLGCAASAKADILQINPGKVIQALASSSPKLAHRRPRFQSTRIEAKFKWTVKALAAATVAGTPEAVLPEDVRRATAVLSSASGDDTVYVLGISHVSNESCRHIRELISAVKPDTVLVELCKDRTGLLLDGEGPPPQKWHTGRVRLVGYSPKQGLPSQQELLGLLKATHNAPVSASDIEDDAVALLSTGLFRSVRPITTPPLPNGAPAFAIEASGALSPAAPLGSIDYAVEERTLPALTEFKIEMDPSLGAFMADVAGIEATALSSDGPALHALLRARAALLEAAEGRCTVAFTGTETGRVTATVTPRSGGSPGSTTGLEGSAVGGQGFGIEPFRRQARQQVRSSTGGFNIMLDGNSQLSTASGAVASSTTPSPTPTADGVVVQPWSQDAATQRTAPPQRGIADAFAAILTQRYAVFQGAAGRTVGISPGAAWRIALEAAAAAGSSQIYLGDRPASVTGRRLAQGIWSSSAPFLLGAVPAAIAAAIVTSEGLGAGGSPLAPLFAALLPLVAGVWPVASPLVEVWRFSRLSASDIEDVVRLKEPLQRPDGSSAPQMVFWGEDALLKWPGAMEPVIHERDEFMARAMAAAVTGAPEGLTPAFVRSQAGVTGSGAAQQTFRYAMPQGADPVVCPIGDGDGTFVPKPAKKLVAVVGTAHVAGIMEAWRRAQAPGADLSLKKLA